MLTWFLCLVSFSVFFYLRVSVITPCSSCGTLRTAFRVGDSNATAPYVRLRHSTAMLTRNVVDTPVQSSYNVIKVRAIRRNWASLGSLCAQSLLKLKLNDPSWGFAFFCFPRGSTNQRTDRLSQSLDTALCRCCQARPRHFIFRPGYRFIFPFLPIAFCLALWRLKKWHQIFHPTFSFAFNFSSFPYLSDLVCSAGWFYFFEHLIHHLRHFQCDSPKTPHRYDYRHVSTLWLSA